VSDERCCSAQQIQSQHILHTRVQLEPNDMPGGAVTNTTTTTITTSRRRYAAVKVQPPDRYLSGRTATVYQRRLSSCNWGWCVFLVLLVGLVAVAKRIVHSQRL